MDIATSTPSAVEMTMGPSIVPEETTPAVKTRPEKPDEEAYKKNLAKAEKEHKEAQDKLNAIKAKIDLAKPQSQDSPVAVRQKELRAELAKIRAEQATHKATRTGAQANVANIEAKLKAAQAEQKEKRSKFPFKSVDEIDRKIKELTAQVDTGRMKLVDEKKALTEVSSLERQKKTFANFDDMDKSITSLRSELTDARKTMDNPEVKALSERYNTITAELDSNKSESDAAFKNLNSLRDERTKLHAVQQEKYMALKEVKDKYHQGRIAYREYDNEQYRIRQEKQKAERDAYAKEKRRKVADQRLEEAANPAYYDEILAAEGLIRHFDPSTPQEVKALRGPSGFLAESQRKVDSSDLKGTVLSKKEDRDDTYFMGTGGKKSKKGRKTAEPGTPTEGKFNLNIGILQELNKVDVEPPSSQADVPALIEKLKAKVTHWKADQTRKTEENIAKAKADIEKLEADAEAEAAQPSPAPRQRENRRGGRNGTTNGRAGSSKQNGVDSITEGVADAKISDKTQ